MNENGLMKPSCISHINVAKLNEDSPNVRLVSPIQLIFTFTDLIAFGSFIYAIGGQTEVDKPYYAMQVEKFDLHNGVWMSIPNLCLRICNPKTVIHQKSLYILGRYQ